MTAKASTTKSNPDGTIEVVLSERYTVKIAPLSALESIKADELVGVNANDQKTSKVYGLASVRAVNGLEVNPLRNGVEFTDLASKFTLAELLALVAASSKQLDATFTADLKKELSSRLPES